jgi:hypothetical protein
MSTLAIANFTEDTYDTNLLVIIDGEQAGVSIATQSHDPRVLGVTTDLTNGELILAEFGNDGTLPYIAISGKIQLQVQGPIGRGDCIVTSDQAGIGQKLDPNKWVPGCIVGKSLDPIDDNSIQLITAVIGLH